MSQRDLLFALAFFALIGFLLFRNLPGALAFVRPAWIRTRVKGGPDGVVGRGPAMRQMLTELEAEGFEPLGVIAEERPLARSREELVLVHREGRCFAGVRSVFDEAWLTLLTPFQDGAVVTTADYRMPSIDEPDHLAGGLPGNGPYELLNAHRRRVQRFVDGGHPPDERLSLESRAEAGRAFFATGPGRREVRRREVKAFVFATVALIWAGTFLVNMVRSLVGGMAGS